MSRTPERKVPSVLRSEQNLWRGFGDAWTSVSTLLSGIVFWGALGFGLDRVFDTAPVLMVIGVLVGNFAAIYLLYVKSSREIERHAS